MKILESKDIIDIALCFELLNPEELLDLICFIFQTQKESYEFGGIFPLSVYNLLVMHDQMAVFDKIFEIEKEEEHCESVLATQIIGKLLNVLTCIANAFNYAIFSNKMLISGHISRKYISYMYQKKEDCIQSLLQIINEYSEDNGSQTYKSGISNIEILLYHVERMCLNFTFKHALLF